MAKKHQIGILYKNDSNWIGGTYYIENLINSLNHLPKEKQPDLLILSDDVKDYEKVKSVTQYPFLSFCSNKWELSLLKRALNKFSRTLINRHVFTKRLDRYVTSVFPNPLGLLYFEIKEKIFWLPDFQHYRLPHFYSKDEIKIRNQRFEVPVNKNYPLVLSSQAAKEDFNEFFPQAKNPVFVVPFAVTLPNLGGKYKEEKTLKKFNINQPFFLCSNQFWAHKNHMIILKAVKLLIKQVPDILFIFTGKEYDPRVPEYTSSLKKFIEDNQLEKNVRFLGFIDRVEQIRIMKHAKAVVQPSLFEGWSTVIEDAKALNKCILASSLLVHKEQLDSYPKESQSFFDPENEEELASCLNHFYNSNITGMYDYNADIISFADRFVSVIDELLQ